MLADSNFPDPSKDALINVIEVLNDFRDVLVNISLELQNYLFAIEGECRYEASKVTQEVVEKAKKPIDHATDEEK